LLASCGVAHLPFAAETVYCLMPRVAICYSEPEHIRRTATFFALNVLRLCKTVSQVSPV